MTTKLQLTAIITATIMVAGIIGVGVSQEAFAKKGGDHFNCFFKNGTFDGVEQTFDAIGKCNGMGKTTLSGSFAVDGIVAEGGFNCVELSSVDTTFSKGGNSITVSSTGVQCFFDENGDQVDVSTSWCSAGGSYTSATNGEYIVTSGTGSLEGAIGNGTISATADHCLDTAVTIIRGTLE